MKYTDYSLLLVDYEGLRMWYGKGSYKFCGLKLKIILRNNKKHWGNMVCSSPGILCMEKADQAGPFARSLRKTTIIVSTMEIDHVYFSKSSIMPMFDICPSTFDKF